MPTLYNTVGNLKFYNFISNQYYNGVAPLYAGNFAQSILIRDWFSTYVFPSNLPIYSSNYIHFYFPKVIGSPTENESCTGANNTTNNYRFKLYMNNDYSLYYNSSSTSQINTQNAGTTGIVIGTTTGPRISGSTSISHSFVFTFAVASPTTIAMFNFVLPDISEKSLSKFSFIGYDIYGWAHDSIYPSPFTTAADRYNACYNIGGTSSGGVVNQGGARPTITGTTSSQSLAVIKYYDINCLTGNYTPGLFFTDLILRDNDNSTGYPMIGKVDNRVACIGRGNFVAGEIYRANNIFGRTGVEDWMCVGQYMPSTNTISNWTPTNTFRRDYYKGWKSGEYDYLMVRIYTEAD